MSGSFEDQNQIDGRRAADVAAALYRAYRGIRLYPADHPSAAETLNRLVDVLRRATKGGALSLDVRETSFAVPASTALPADSQHDDIAHEMFLDGVRSITFAPGVDAQEAAAFLGALLRAGESERLEHDLATILWELDLPHISFTIADPLLDEQAWDGKGGMLAQVKGELADVSAESPLDDLGEPVEPDLGPRARQEYRLLVAGAPATPEEIEALVSMDEGDQDILGRFLEVLIEVLADAETDADVSSVAHSISDVLQSYLEWGEFRALATAAERLDTVAHLRPDLAGVTKDMLAALAAPEAVRKAVTGLDSRGPESRADLEDLLYSLRAQTYPVLVRLLADVDGKIARRCMLNVCTRGEGVPADLVIPMLDDSRWYVVRNMVYLLGSRSDPVAYPHIESTLSHPDERVRREAVRALGSIGGEKATRSLARSLDDPASSVRILAARNLPRGQRETAASILLAHVASRGFAERTTLEIEAFFEVLAEVARDEDIPALAELWSGHSWSRNRPLPVRLGALGVVAAMTSPAAREAVASAAQSGDDEVRRRARAALAAARTIGPPEAIR